MALAVGGTTVPAHADTTATTITKATAAESDAATARMAWVGACKDADGLGHPCGAWRLRLRAGGTVTVAGASATAVDARGRKADIVGAFAISGDGQWILYERVKDHRLVVRKVAGGRGDRPAGLADQEGHRQSASLALARGGQGGWWSTTTRRRASLARSSRSPRGRS
ncbi:hypothetical protein [Nonomuraea dietziae]|uniref:hypothetical protein n=1 Tax=Nonomuraea dietziae TaxID=65515 RepID=UPI0031D5C539